jgi:predicted short-subunit dehydrogenase-like oxidoreductase (DUF2520 family)
MTQQMPQNYERLGPRAAWTGPLARGDYDVVAKHLNVLQDYSPQYKEAYQALNHLAERVFERDSAGNAKQSGKLKAQATGGKA